MPRQVSEMPPNKGTPTSPQKTNPRFAIGIVAAVIVTFVIGRAFRKDENTSTNLAASPAVATPTTQMPPKTSLPDSQGTTSSTMATPTSAPTPTATAETSRLCPATACRDSAQVPVLHLGLADQPRLMRDQVLTIHRATLPFCVQIGDLVTLARYEARLSLSFWVGEAKIISARQVTENDYELRLIVQKASPNETRILAPVCTRPCRAVSQLKSLNSEGAVVVVIGPSTNSLPVPRANIISLPKLSPQDLRSLQTVQISKDPNGYLVLSLPKDTLEWKPVLDWFLATAKQTGRRPLWLVSPSLGPDLVPPPVSGVAEISLQWLARLEREKAALISTSIDVSSIPWNGEKISGIKIQLPTTPPAGFRDAGMIGPWNLYWPHLHQVLRRVDSLKTLVVLSESYSDYQSYYLARLLEADRRPNVYWFRSDARNWRNQVPYDSPLDGMEEHEP